MTKLISLKLDEKLLEEVQMLADREGISRNKYINEAIVAFNTFIQVTNATLVNEFFISNGDF